MLNKKEKERLALNKYLEASEQFFEFDDFESPDFILKVDDKLIGCEVTEFYPDYGSKGSKLRKRESHLNKLHHELRSKLIKKYLIGFSFSVSYKQYCSGKTPIKLEVEKVIGKLQYLSDYKIVDNPTINIRQIFIRKIGNLPSRISLMISTDYQEPKNDWFEPIIESKSTLLQNWKGNYAQNWLLISVGLSRSGDVTLNKIKDLKKLNTKNWDKVILIDVSFNDYVEINAT
jgi:hypothetical protein